MGSWRDTKPPHCMLSFTSQTHFRKGLVNCGTITLQYFVCLSTNSSLENSGGGLGHLSTTARAVKALLLRKHAYSTTGKSRVHY